MPWENKSHELSFNWIMKKQPYIPNAINKIFKLCNTSMKMLLFFKEYNFY